MKTLGIIGGIAPPSTSTTTASSSRVPGPESRRRIPLDPPQQHQCRGLFAMLADGDREVLADYLVPEVDRLARAALAVQLGEACPQAARMGARG